MRELRCYWNCAHRETELRKRQVDGSLVGLFARAACAGVVSPDCGDADGRHEEQLNYGAEQFIGGYQIADAYGAADLKPQLRPRRLRSDSPQRWLVCEFIDLNKFQKV